MTTFDESQRHFRENYPNPGPDPMQRLAHVLEIYADRPDDAWAIEATRNVYSPGVTTGLTWGDLRALVNRMFPVFPHEHYRRWSVPSVLGPMTFRTSNHRAQWWSELERMWKDSEDANNTTEFLRVYPEAAEIRRPDGAV